MSRGPEFAKASGRSFGEFSMAAVIHHTDTVIEKGGGHLAAGGLTVRSERIDEWRVAVQEFYRGLALSPTRQREFLYPSPDVTLTDFASLTPGLLDEIKQLEPFGHGNPAPVFAFSDMLILARRTMGAGGNHVRYTFADADGRKLTTVAFGAADKFTLTPLDDDGRPQRAQILVELMQNEWNGKVSVEGRLLRLEAVETEE
jgi:single-stranded-DNA-specific exonuclease